MMDERWTSQKAPLVVLSCAKSSEHEEPKLTCVDVVEELKLCEMNRRWQVNIQLNVFNHSLCQPPTLPQAVADISESAEIVLKLTI